MTIPYDASYSPPVPILHIRLAAPDESPRVGPLTAIVDTGADATLIPSEYLEAVEAIGSGNAVLRGVLGETRDVHLFEVDIHIDSVVLPDVVVVADDHGSEVVMGRSALNKLILLLDGPHGETELFEHRPRLR